MWWIAQHPHTLEDLKVMAPEGIEVDNENRSGLGWIISPGVCRYNFYCRNHGDLKVIKQRKNLTES